MQKFLPLLLCLYSCTTFDETEIVPEELQEEVTVERRDPNSMEVMREAVEKVAEKRGLATTRGEDIVATHRYVCFEPASKWQFDALFDVEGWQLFNFPIDQVDPVVEEREFEKLYAVLPVTDEMPDSIAWTTLKELYDPAVAPEGAENPEWAEEVRDAAYQIAMPFSTGNAWDAPGGGGDGSLFLGPSGTIRAWDDIVGGYVPLEGVRVTITDAYNILRSYTRNTNSNGSFSFFGESLSGPYSQLGCSLSWDSDFWVIKKGDGKSADIPIPYNSSTGRWNLNIGKGTEDFGPATAYRAAYRLWFKTTSLRIALNELRKVRICCDENAEYLNGNDLGYYLFRGPYAGEDGLPDIKIACKEKRAQDLFAYTCHELGHMVQLRHFDSLNRSHPTKFITESWAEFVAYLLCEQEYKELGVYDKYVPMKSFTISNTPENFLQMGMDVYGRTFEFETDPSRWRTIQGPYIARESYTSGWREEGEITSYGEINYRGNPYLLFAAPDYKRVFRMYEDKVIEYLNGHIVATTPINGSYTFPQINGLILDEQYGNAVNAFNARLRYTGQVIPPTIVQMRDYSDFNFQKWTSIGFADIYNYSPLFIDMYDDYDQKFWYTYGHPATTGESVSDVLHLIPSDKIHINNPLMILLIALNSDNATDAERLMRQYAAQQYGYNKQQLDEFWELYSKADTGEYY